MTFAAARGAIQRPKARARSVTGSRAAATFPVTLDTVPDAMSIRASVLAAGPHMYNVLPVGSTNEVARPSNGGSGVDPTRVPSTAMRSKRRVAFVEQTTHHACVSTGPAARSSHAGARVGRVATSPVIDPPSNDADQWSTPDGGDSCSPATNQKADTSKLPVDAARSTSGATLVTGWPSSVTDGRLRSPGRPMTRPAATSITSTPSFQPSDPLWTDQPRNANRPSGEMLACPSTSSSWAALGKFGSARPAVSRMVVSDWSVPSASAMASVTLSRLGGPPRADPSQSPQTHSHPPPGRATTVVGPLCGPKTSGPSLPAESSATR